MIYAFDTGRLSRAITDDGVPEISGRLELDSWDCEGIDFQMKFLSKQTCYWNGWTSGITPIHTSRQSQQTS
jgi:hypothetical protein